jgi:steroid delta-isomerase-like uncharacterized protein
VAETSVKAGAGVDLDFVTGFAERWGAAWNSHRPERLLELMTEDIVYEDDAWHRTMRGHGDVREFLEAIWRAMPDLEFELAEGPFLHPSEPVATFYWRGTGTFTGPLQPPGLAPTGARVELDGFDLHEYRDGRVCRLRIVFDMLEMSRQLGLMPARGSRAEKASAAVQRLGMHTKRRFERGRDRFEKRHERA